MFALVNRIAQLTTGHRASPVLHNFLARKAVGFLLLVSLLTGCATIPTAQINTAQIGADRAGEAAQLARRSSPQSIPPATRQGQQTGDALVPDRLELASTFNSIGVELLYTGDANGNAMASLQFKKSSDEMWRDALPPWQVSTASPSAFYGSVLLVDPATSYDLRVSLTDPDGVVGNEVLVGSITTRVEDIVSSDILVPSHYVRTTGDDKNDGTSEATAWRTIKKAMTSAPSGAVVQVGPGFYAATGTTRTTPLTLLAQNSAISYDASTYAWTPSDPATHSVIQYGLVSSPSGSGEPNSGVWQPVTFTDPLYPNNYPDGVLPPPGSVQHTLWKWSLPTQKLQQHAQLGYASSLGEFPQRIATWSLPYSGYSGGGGNKGDQINTPDGFAEKLYTNKIYNYGFMVLPNASGGSDIWLRLPGDRDPNEFYLTFGQGAAFTFNTPECRLSGFEVRNFQNGVRLGSTSDRCVVDHNLFSGNFKDVNIVGTAGQPSLYPGDIVVQYNLMRNDGIWSADTV
ncbi:MAG: DUF1565 domain-containing protein, partial [Chloroflexota bacterium]